MLDKSNGNTLWWDSILKEMVNLGISKFPNFRIASDTFEGEKRLATWFPGGFMPHDI
jgi:hypothetical protein